MNPRNPAPVDYADRRAEVRYTGDGDVDLHIEEPVREDVIGMLVDYSNSGFRAVHHCSNLHTGQVVHFRHFVASGTARVIWNRILPERIESGFLVVSP
jgi:hypothetical protein